MSHSTPTRSVKCQVCPWTGIRRYGANGILSQPCPQCQHRLTYAVACADDQPITRDTGEPRQPSKPRRTLTLEHKLRMAAGRARVSAFRMDRAG
jgi:hypothetical protein